MTVFRGYFPLLKMGFIILRVVRYFDVLCNEGRTMKVLKNPNYTPSTGRSYFAYLFPHYFKRQYDLEVKHM